jgi:hypothetical protein
MTIIYRNSPVLQVGDGTPKDRESMILTFSRLLTDAAQQYSIAVFT